MSSLRTLIVLGIALAFAAGLTVGHLAFSPGAAKRETTYLQRLQTSYDLRPDQVERIRAILDDEEKAIDVVLEQAESTVRDGIQMARAGAQEKIRAALDDEQRARFDQDLLTERNN